MGAACKLPPERCAQESTGTVAGGSRRPGDAERTTVKEHCMANRRTTGSVRPSESPPPAEKAVPRRRAAPEKPAAASGASTGIAVSEDARRAMIAQAAYLRAERREFAPGGQVEDWLAAEAEVDALLKARHDGQPQ
jgi:hypothetical protein